MLYCIIITQPSFLLVLNSAYFAYQTELKRHTGVSFSFHMLDVHMYMYYTKSFAFWWEEFVNKCVFLFYQVQMVELV